MVSPHNDTIHSVATVHAARGFRLELPDMGDRFVSIQITDENHMTPFSPYGGGTHNFTADQFETDYAGAGIRTATDGSETDVRAVTRNLQPHYRISGAADVDAMPRPDLDKLAAARAALVRE